MGKRIDSTYEPGERSGALRAAIERLQAAELAAHPDYLNAIKSEPGQAARCLKAWTTILEQLRKIEVEHPTIEKENSQTVTKEELAKELGELFRRTSVKTLIPYPVEYRCIQERVRHNYKRRLRKESARSLMASTLAGI